LLLHPFFEESIVQALLEHVADGALGIGSAGVKRDGVEDVAGEFGAQKDEAYLGPVPMGYDYIPAFFNHPGYVPSRLASSCELIGDSLMLRVFYQGISANGYYC
jgi:hypothetical protein